MRDDLRLVQIAFGEQRADRTVDQAAGEDFFFRRTSFALDEAAGKLAGGVSVFAIIHGERKKAAFGFGFWLEQAVTRTTVSPDLTTTAPFACLAILPVSIVISGLRRDRSQRNVTSVSP